MKVAGGAAQDYGCRPIRARALPAAGAGPATAVRRGLFDRRWSAPPCGLPVFIALCPGQSAPCSLSRA